MKQQYLQPKNQNMKQILMMMVVTITTIATRAQTDSISSVRWVKSFFTIGSMVHKVQPPLHLGLATVSGGPTTTAAVTNLASVSFFPKKKITVGVFAGLSYESGEQIGGSIDGKNFNINRDLFVTYAGAVFFYRTLELGVGYQSKKNDGSQTFDVRVYVKSTNFIFSSDVKLSNYFGYYTPFVSKVFAKKFRLRAGVYATQNGIGPVLRITEHFGNIFVFTTVKKNTYSTGINIGF